MNKTFYFNVYKDLIRTDILIARQTFLDKFIDLTIWVVLTVGVTGYIMPYFGLSNFGVFQLGGIIAATGLFELYSNAVDLVGDFEGDRVINYYLTLPIPSWLVILAKASYYFILYLTLAIIMLPIGKICLWNQLDLTTINYGKLLLALIFQSMFYSCFVLWAASTIENMARLGNIWARYIFPMWFMGGFQFSWLALFSIMPAIAYLTLINPMMYITEAVRTSILGQAEYLNFWMCLAAIALFSALSLYLSMYNLKKRLDFV